MIIKNVNGIGQGELESMALAMNLSANRLLIDDAKAKKVALLNQIKVIGSLGILLLAKQQNLLDEFNDVCQKPHRFITMGLFFCPVIVSL